MMKSEHRFSRPISFLWVAICYALAFGAGILTLEQSSGSLVWKVLISDVVMTVIVYAFSLAFRNASMYDPYWSVIPMFYALWLNLEAGFTPFGWLMLAAVFLWGFRLTLNWIRGWPGLHHEDWRYILLRQQNPKIWQLVNFGGIHLIPTLFVFLGMLPMVYSLPGISGITLFGVAGAAIATLGTALELISDEQMRRFKRSAQPGQIMQEGLWKYCRHPNYLGELTFWFGLWIMILDGENTLWWTGIGWVAMVLLFVFISVPMMDKKNLGSKPGYAEHKKQVPALLPVGRGK